MARKLRVATVGPKRADTSIAKLPPKTAEPFYLSAGWRRLVASLIAERGRRCECCGRTHEDDGRPVRIVGDHIVERRDGGADLDPANIKLLALGCHNRKTAGARAERMARKS